MPIALLLTLETAAVFTLGHRRSVDSDALVLCSRCARLHERTEKFGRAADAVAVGALAFLVALPFVAAGYESGFTLPHTVLGISAVAAVIAAGGEAYFLTRVAAARLLPHLTWSAERARIVGGGARWLGAVLALYLFSFNVDVAATTAPFGAIGERLVADLASTWTIMAAAAILAGALLVALSARWLVPLVYGSLPTAFAASRDPHGNAT
ncbi:MAG: hypothetical protein ABR591_13720 [Candidatus Velthaea sp.]